MFLLRPPPVVRVGSTLNLLIDVAAEAGVGHVVFSSVAGADRNRLLPHHRVERHLEASSLAWTVLRPGFFAQNLGDAYRYDIAHDDRLYVPAGAGRVAFLDVRDLADVAAEIFRDPTPHRGRGYTLTGPGAVTFAQAAQAAQVLASVLGRPISYEPASALDYLRHLRARGLPAGRCAVQLILHLGLRRGTPQPSARRSSSCSGGPSRTITDYITDHRALWRRADGVD